MTGDADDPSDDDDVPSGEAKDSSAAQDDSAENDDDSADEPDEPIPGDDPNGPPLDAAIVRRYLSTRKARNLARTVVRKILPRHVVLEVADDAIERALRARPPSLEVVLPSWLAAIAHRRAIRWLEKEARRAKYVGEMPEQVTREDDYTGEAIDDDGAGEPPAESFDDDDGEPLAHLGTHLRALIGDNVRDLAVLAMIYEQAERSIADIARSRNLTEDQVAGRIKRFKAKYKARAERRKERMAILLWAGGGALAAAALIAVIYLFSLFRHRPDEIGPDPSRAVPTAPSASASAPVLLQALPPSPGPSAPPDDGNKPKAPRP